MGFGVPSGGTPLTFDFFQEFASEACEPAGSEGNVIQIVSLKPTSNRAATGWLLGIMPRHMEVCDLWQTRHGWTTWPAARRHDATLISHWVRRKDYPLGFWQDAFSRVPLEAPFRYLTTPSAPGRTCRLEQWFLQWQDAHRAVEPAVVPMLALRTNRLT